MSGLEKFQTSETWRTNFKKFLFMERKPEIIQKKLTKSEHQRYSLDIAEDLKHIIVEKKNQKVFHLNEETLMLPSIATGSYTKSEINMSNTEAKVSDEENANCYDGTICREIPIWQKSSNESFEALEKMCEKTISDPNSTLFKYLNAEAEHKSNNVIVSHKTIDETFEALERMCDKTASDANSTLFQYLHSEHKEQILAEVKKRHAGLISHMGEDNLLLKFSNCTLLDDVEAPSRMWENTVCSDTVLQTSPVKIVGLLRPSTIIEEAPDDSENSNISSQISFSTATKGGQSDVSSCTYETADDFVCSSSKYRTQKVKSSKLNDFFSNVLTKNEQTKEIEADISPIIKTVDCTFVEEFSASNKGGENNPDISNISVDLIDLEKTFGAIPWESGETDVINIGNEVDSQNSEDSVIEILSDEEGGDVIKSDIDKNYCKEHLIQCNIKTEISSKTDSSFNHDMLSLNVTHDSDKENLCETDEPLEKSPQFNDTIEEVEYVLKKGLEYMTAQSVAKRAADANAVKHVHSLDSKVKSSAYIAPAKKMSSPKSHCSTPKHFSIDIRPFPKLDIFTKPSEYGCTKVLSGKQRKFSHIISPIGTYMKKTARTPLMSSLNCKNKEYCSSTAILELENESRLYQPPFAATGMPMLPGLMSRSNRALPKKAYISSDLKHIVDERTPITIPGGQKIQKYLENAMMPAVLRHEGKLKITGGIGNEINSSSEVPSKLPLQISDTNSAVPHVSRRNNASLADLSLMSGDVSMYTIMDAQKF